MSRALVSIIICLPFFFTDAAARELEKRVAGPTADPVRYSSTAFAGSRFLTVWEQQTGDGTHIFGALSDASGKRISNEAFVVIPDSRAATLSLTSLGDRFALFWRDQAARSHLAEIDREGLTVSRRELSPFLRLTGAWNGEHFLAFGAPPGAGVPQASLVDRSGNVVRSGIPIGDDRTSALRVIARSDRSFVAFLGGYGDLTAVPISPDGTVGTSVLIERAGGTTTTAYYPIGPAALELPDGRVLAVWTGYQYGRVPQLKTTLLSRAGDVTAPISLPVSAYTDIQAVQVVRDRAGLSVYFRATRERLSGAELWEVAGIRIDADGRPLDSEPTVIDTGFPYASTFAFASSGDTTLAVTYPFNPPPRSIQSYALPKPAAAPPSVLSLTPSTQNEVRVGGNSAGLVAVWNDFIGQGTTVRAASIDAAGALTSKPTIYPGNLVSPRMVSGPSDHLFLRTTSTNLIASRIGPDGRSLRDVNIEPGDSYQNADAVWTGAGYLIATSRGSRLYTGLLAGDEPLVMREIALPAAPPGYGRDAYSVRLAFDGRTTVVLWTDFVGPICLFPGPCGEITVTLMGMRLSPAGVPIDSVPVEIAPRADSHGLFVASDREFLLYLTLDRSVRVLTADSSGLHVGPAQRVPQDFYILRDLAWNGTTFAAVMDAMEKYVTFGHFDRRGTFTWDPRAVITGGRTQSVRIAARGTELLAGVAVAEHARPFRAHVFTRDDLVPLPALPEATSITGIVAAPNGGAIVSWRPAANADGYLIEALNGGRFSMIGFAGPHETSKYTGWPMHYQFRVRPFNAGGISTEPPRRRSVGR